MFIIHLLLLAVPVLGQLIASSPSNGFVCGPVSLTWTWNGPQVGATIDVTNDVPENKGSTSSPIPPDPVDRTIARNVDTLYQNFTWSTASVPRGWYAFRLYDSVALQFPVVLTPSFFIEGQTTSPDKTCPPVVFEGTLIPRPTPSEPAPSEPATIATTAPTLAPTPSQTTIEDSPSGSGGLGTGAIAGIVVAIVGALLIGLLFFFCRRRRQRRAGSAGGARASRVFGKIDPAASAEEAAKQQRHVGRWGGLGSVDSTAERSGNGSVAADSTVPSSQFPFTPSTGTPQPNGPNQNPFASQSNDSSDGELEKGAEEELEYVPPPLVSSQHRRNSSQARNRVSGTLKDYVEQQGYAMGAYTLPTPTTPSPIIPSLPLSSAPTPAPNRAQSPMPTAIITTPQFTRSTSTNGGLSQPRRKPAPVYEPTSIELRESANDKGPFATPDPTRPSTATSTGGVSAFSPSPPTGGGHLNRSSSNLMSLGLAAEGDGPVHYLIPDLPPPQPHSR